MIKNARSIKSIDRLGRNYEEILEQWAYITKTCRAAIVVQALCFRALLRS